MVILFIFILLIILSIFLSIIFSKYKDSLTAHFIISSITITILFLVVISGKPDDKKIINYYNQLKERVEKINKSECKEVINTCFPEFKKEVDNINNIIKNHRENYKSSWNGWFFSEDVANLEEIKYE